MTTTPNKDEARASIARMIMAGCEHSSVQLYFYTLGYNQAFVREVVDPFFINTSEAFADRFSYEDWSYLCTKEAFLSAVNRKDFEAAENLAEEYLFHLSMEQGTGALQLSHAI
jgi:hypothetical protein